MKVLLLNGSPHTDGSTAAVLGEARDQLARNGVDGEIFNIGTGPFYGCVGCRKCAGLGQCVFGSDPANEIAEKIKSSDGLIVGSPVYYGGANGALCALLERVFFSRDRSCFEYKPAACVVVCRRGGNASAFDRLNKFFTISNMYVVGSQYWNMVYGTNAQEVRQDLEGMQTVRRLADNMSFLLRKFEAAPGVAAPGKEQRVGTNFIR